MAPRTGQCGFTGAGMLLLADHCSSSRAMHQLARSRNARIAAGREWCGMLRKIARRDGGCHEE